MARVINFSPGPATLPLPVLEQIQNELLDFEGSGISMLEHSHRGAHYSAVHAEAKARLLRLLGCTETHEALFMTGGASTQAALLAMNFLQGGTADYVDTGVWSEKAYKAAKHFGAPRWAASGRNDAGRVVRAPMNVEMAEGARYLHLTSNATVSGVQYHDLPGASAAGVPRIVDASSDILHKAMDLSGVEMVYAGAQKNLGPAGVTIVVVRKDFLAQAAEDIAPIFSYRFFAEKDSLGNTAPTFPIYVVGRVLQWLEEEGGAEEMGRRSGKKAALLYGILDASDGFYQSPVERDSRSAMNAVFTLPSDELTKAFIDGAAEEGMVNLKGHRSVGGIRVSMYNAMPVAHVEKLVDYMATFEKKHR